MFKRTLLPIALAFVVLPALAQSADYSFFRSSVPLQRTHLKLIIEELQAVDPQASAFLSDDGTIVQVRHALGVQVAAQVEAFQRAGIAVQPTHVETTSRNASTVDAQPVYVVTGDEQADRARYQQAVEAWNAAHPDLPLGSPVHLIEQ